MPQPTSTGGMMGYATSVDTGGIVPQILGVTGAENAQVAAAVTAGRAFFAPITINTQVTIAQMRTWFSGSPTGNCDLGIYDSTGTNGAPNNRLGSTGANAAAGGMFTKSLTANAVLPPGVYWLAFLDTVADSVHTRTMAVAGLGAIMQTSATNLTVLPSTAGTVADSVLLIELYALISGGFS